VNAEIHLRLLAEAELRRAMTRSSGPGPHAGRAAGMKRVAQVLSGVGALGNEVADQILEEFELALAARQDGSAVQRRWVLARLMPSAAGRGRPGRLVSMPPPAAGMRAAAGSGTGAGAVQGHPPAPAGPQAGPGRIVRLGQRIMGGGADASGEIYLLSYARTASGPQFSVFARTRHWSGAWEPSGPRFFDRFIATDDRDQLPDNHP